MSFLIVDTTTRRGKDAFRRSLRFKCNVLCNYFRGLNIATNCFPPRGAVIFVVGCCGLRHFSPP